jgi:hypothetical protein
LWIFWQNQKQPFEPSQLYEVSTKQKIVDVDMRRSVFRAITEPALFDLASDFVKHLSSLDKDRDYTLVKNDCSHIKYAAGDFFGSHEDFLSLTSNVIEEWTLIVNVQRPGSLQLAEGGKTKIKLHNTEYLSSATTTPGCALAFRKDLQHEGLLVTKNNKEILSMNLFVTKKTSKQILLVNFASDVKPSITTLSELAKGSSSYALLMSEVMVHALCPLAVFCEDNSEKIIEYLCEDASHESFALIYKIIRGEHVSAADVANGAHLLDFYGLNTNAVLVDVAERQLAEGTELMKQLDWISPSSALTGIAQTRDQSSSPTTDNGLDDPFYTQKNVLLDAEQSIVMQGVETIVAQTSDRSVNEYVEDFIHFNLRQVQEMLLLAHETREGQIFTKLETNFPVNRVTTEALKIVSATIKQQQEEEGHHLIEVEFQPEAKNQIGLELTNAHRAFKHSLLQRVIVSGMQPGSMAETCGDIKVGDILCGIDCMALFGLGDTIDDEGVALGSAASVMNYVEAYPVRTNNEAPLQLNFLRQVSHMSLPEDDVIICNNAQRTQIVAAAALKMQLPYVPFRAVFVEGDIKFWGDGLIGAPPLSVSMLPTWLSLGDYDNIFGMRLLLY